MAPAKAEKVLAEDKKEEPRLKAHVEKLDVKLKDIDSKIEQSASDKKKQRVEN